MALLQRELPTHSDWSPEELAILRSVWIGSLPLPPTDPTNAFADDPKAAEFGHHLFFDERLSANNQVSCATCHIPEQAFTDGDPVAHGTRPNNRNTMTVIGSVFAPWLLWDGHKDSLWSQAVEPIEAVDEQGTTRLHAVHLIAADNQYRMMYEQIFGPLPPLEDFSRFPDSGGPVDFLDYREQWETMTAADQALATQVFVNMGKAIAAYEMRLIPGKSRFDHYVESLIREKPLLPDEGLADVEIQGLRLFIGQADCVRCHNGPLFSDFAFHNTGVPPTGDLTAGDHTAEKQPTDEGRVHGLANLLTDEFRCASSHRDGGEEPCTTKPKEGRSATLVGAFRTPMLRSAAETGPYMHAGQLATLDEVIRHYRTAPQAAIGISTLHPLTLSDGEISALVAFLYSLSAPPNVAAPLMAPP